MNAPTYDLIDKAIAIAIVLFVLSMIAERFVTWTKLTFGVEGKKLFFFSTKEENIAIKSSDPVLEKKRERKIIGLNIVLSTLIAFAAHANLFNIIGSELDPYRNLGWNNFSVCEFFELGFWAIVSKLFFGIIGTFLCGLFISLGSKFWHDLLDMLLYSKNLKEKLVDKETYNIDRVDQLDKWLQVTQSEIISKVLDDNKALLKGLKNVISFGIGTADDKSKIIEVLINDSDDHLIPKLLYYEMPNGKSAPVKVITIKSSPISAQAKFEINLSEKISNGSRTERFGSFGCIVSFCDDKTNKPYLLTCYHVLKDPTRSFNTFDSTAINTVAYDGDKNKIIGTTINGIRDNEIDVAIMEPNKDTILINNIPAAGAIKGIKVINTNDVESKTEVFLKGANTKEGKQGVVRSVYSFASINYKNLQGIDDPWELYNLISISDSQGKTLSKGGDSGTAVIDKNNNIIGIVVGGNNERTYVIPITTILTRMNLKLI